MEQDAVGPEVQILQEGCHQTRPSTAQWFVRALLAVRVSHPGTGALECVRTRATVVQGETPRHGASLLEGDKKMRQSATRRTASSTRPEMPLAGRRWLMHVAAPYNL